MGYLGCHYISRSPWIEQGCHVCVSPPVGLMTSVRWIYVKVGRHMPSDCKTKPSALWLMSLLRPELIKKPSVADVIVWRIGLRLQRLLVMQPNIRSLNKRSLRTLKGNEAQGTAVAVCVYYRQRTIQNPKKASATQEEQRESCWRQNWVLSVAVDGVGFCSHHNNVQSCYKLCTGQKSNTSYPFTQNGNAWNNITDTHIMSPARLRFF